MWPCMPMLVVWFAVLNMGPCKQGSLVFAVSGVLALTAAPPAAHVGIFQHSLFKGPCFNMDFTISQG